MESSLKNRISEGKFLTGDTLLLTEIPIPSARGVIAGRGSAITETLGRTAGKLMVISGTHEVISGL